jgi:hypothetical protein
MLRVQASGNVELITAVTQTVTFASDSITFNNEPLHTCFKLIYGMWTTAELFLAANRKMHCIQFLRTKEQKRENRHFMLQRLGLYEA